MYQSNVPFIVRQVYLIIESLLYYNAFIDSQLFCWSAKEYFIFLNLHNDFVEDVCVHMADARHYGCATVYILFLV